MYIAFILSSIQNPGFHIIVTVVKLVWWPWWYYCIIIIHAIKDFTIRIWIALTEEVQLHDCDLNNISINCFWTDTTMTCIWNNQGRLYTPTRGAVYSILRAFEIIHSILPTSNLPSILYPGSTSSNAPGLSFRKDFAITVSTIHCLTSLKAASPFLRTKHFDVRFSSLHLGFH